MTSVEKASQQHVDSLNLVRVGLIFVIFLCHSGDFLPDIIGAYAGVLTGYALQIFFLISGFCCLLSGYSKKLSTGSYYFAKWKKIFPLHFIGYLLMVFLIFYRANLSGVTIEISEFIKQSIVNLTFLQSWTPNEDYVYSFNGVSWFLSSLFFCYLLTPLMIRCLKKFERHAPWLLLVIILGQYIYSTLFRYYINVGTFCYVNVFPPFRFLEYLAGALVGVIYLQRCKRGCIYRSSAIQIVSIVIFFGSIFAFSRGSGWVGDLSLVFEVFLFASLCFYEGVVSDIGKTKICASLAVHVMPFFLLHSIILKYTRTFIYDPYDYYCVFDPIPCMLSWLFALACAVALSYGYLWVDKKIRAVFKRRVSIAS